MATNVQAHQRVLSWGDQEYQGTTPTGSQMHFGRGYTTGNLLPHRESTLQGSPTRLNDAQKTGSASFSSLINASCARRIACALEFEPKAS